MWDLGWKKWHWERFFSELINFPVNIIPPLLCVFIHVSSGGWKWAHWLPQFHTDSLPHFITITMRDIVDVIQMFFSRELKTVEETNRYTKQFPCWHKWSSWSAAGLFMLMGIIQIILWDHISQFHCHQIAKIYTLVPICLLLQCLQILVWKVPFFVFWTGHLSFKQYFPLKAPKFGTKIYELCDATTGYL
jgi:hypothetical protein